MEKENLVPELQQQTVEVVPGSITFSNYETLMASAKRLADRVKTVEVTPETVKANKDLRAKLNHSLQDLHKDRMTVQKQWSAPLDEFKNQVKEISNVVGEASSIIDKQISDIEAQERGEKRDRLAELYRLHCAAYPDFPVKFDDFIAQNPKLLNKTPLIDKCEQAIADFISKVNTDLNAFASIAHYEEIRDEYLRNGFDFAAAMASVNAKWQRIEAAKAAEPKPKPERSRAEVSPKVETVTAFKIFSEKDAAFAELLLKQNDIKFEKVDL